MAYQPLYATITDNQGYHRGTSCLRGRVDNISMWLNSWFGEVLKISCSLVDGSNIVGKPDLRTIKKEKREEALNRYEEEKEMEDKIILNINIPSNKKVKLSLNGVPISYDRLKIMEDMQLKQMDKQIEVLKSMKKDNKVLELIKVFNQ